LLFTEDNHLIDFPLYQRVALSLLRQLPLQQQTSLESFIAKGPTSFAWEAIGGEEILKNDPEIIIAGKEKSPFSAEEEREYARRLEVWEEKQSQEKQQKQSNPLYGVDEKATQWNSREQRTVDNLSRMIRGEKPIRPLKGMEEEEEEEDEEDEDDDDEEGEELQQQVSNREREERGIQRRRERGGGRGGGNQRIEENSGSSFGPGRRRQQLDRQQRLKELQYREDEDEGMDETEEREGEQPLRRDILEGSGKLANKNNKNNLDNSNDLHPYQYPNQDEDDGEEEEEHGFEEEEEELKKEYLQKRKEYRDFDNEKTLFDDDDDDDLFSRIIQKKKNLRQKKNRETSEEQGTRAGAGAGAVENPGRKTATTTTRTTRKRRMSEDEQFYDETSDDLVKDILD
jgi:hypothetical protein